MLQNLVGSDNGGTAHQRLFVAPDNNRPAFDRFVSFSEMTVPCCNYSFSALTLLVGSLVPDMAGNVFSGTLNLTLSISLCCNKQPWQERKLGGKMSRVECLNSRALHAGIMIYDTLVNTHIHTDRQLLIGYTVSSAS